MADKVADVSKLDFNKNSRPEKDPVSQNSEVRTFEDVLKLIKPLGGWQMRNFTLMLVVSIFFGILQMYTHFWVITTPEFVCSESNVNAAVSRNSSSTVDHCLRSDGSKCTNFTFLTENTLHSTAMTEFGLVCDKAYGFQFALNAFLLGIGVACFLSATVGYTDRFGRKRVMVFGLVTTAVSYALGGQSPTFEIWLLSRFLMPFIGSELVWSSMLPLGMEMTVAKYRPYIGVIPSAGWNLGSIISCFFAWLLRDWRQLQSFSAIPMLLMAVICHFVIPESPRWLLVNGYVDRAKTVLKKAARLNGVELSADVDFDKIATCISDEEKQTVARDFRVWKRLWNKVLITRLLMDMYWVATSAFVWWGLSYYSPQLPVNLFVLSAVMSCGAFMGNTAAALCMSFIPRKASYCLVILSSGLVLLILPWLPGDHWLLIMVLAFLGKVMSGAAWSIASVYAAEFFPTTMRGSLPHVGTSFGYLIGATISGAATDIAKFAPHLKWLPAVLMACSTVPAALLMLIPPETMGRRLPDHVADVAVQDEAHHEHSRALRKESSWAS